MMDHISVVAFIIICGAIHACAQTSTTDLTESGQQVLVNTYMELAQALTTDGVGSIVLFEDIKLENAPSPVVISNHSVTITGPGTPQFSGSDPINRNGSALLDFSNFFPVIELTSTAVLELANLEIIGIISQYEDKVQNLELPRTVGSWLHPVVVPLEAGARIVLRNVLIHAYTRGVADCSSASLEQLALNYAVIFGSTNATGVHADPPSLWISGPRTLNLLLTNFLNESVGVIPLDIDGVTWVCLLDSQAKTASDESSGLSTGAWLGIALGIAAGVVLIAGLVALGLHKRRRAAAPQGLLSDIVWEPGSGDPRESRGSTVPTKLEAFRSAQTEMSVLNTLRIRFGGLDGLEIGHLIGRGAYGRVYRGSMRGATVAVKVVEHTVGPGEEVSAATVRSECLLLTGLSHPNILRLYRTMTIRLQQTTQFSNTPASPTGTPPSEYVPGSPRTSPNAVVVAATTGLSDQGPSSPTSSIAKESIAGQPDPGPSSVEGMPWDGAMAPGLYETWLVLEYCEKGSLLEALRRRKFHIRKEPRMDLILGVLSDVAEGCRYLHSDANVIHGDLKLGNVLLKSGSKPGSLVAIVADFGLSTVLDSDNPQKTIIRTQSLGTLQYMSPELLQSGKLSKAADVWAFGVMMWELWGGQMAWKNMTGAQIFFTVHQGTRLPPLDNCPPEYVAVMEACVTPDSKQRCSFDWVCQRLHGLREAHSQSS